MRECELPRRAIKESHARVVYILNRTHVRDGVYLRPRLIIRGSIQPLCDIAEAAVTLLGQRIFPITMSRAWMFSDTALSTQQRELCADPPQLSATRKELLVGKNDIPSRSRPVLILRAISPRPPTRSALSLSVRIGDFTSRADFSLNGPWLRSGKRGPISRSHVSSAGGCIMGHPQSYELAFGYSLAHRQCAVGRNLLARDRPADFCDPRHIATNSALV